MCIPGEVTLKITHPILELKISEDKNIDGIDKFDHKKFGGFTLQLWVCSWPVLYTEKFQIILPNSLVPMELSSKIRHIK